MPSDYSSPLLPTRSVPSFASDPRYLEELRARKLREMQSRQPTPSTASPSFHSRNAMSSAEGPMLDGMQASELFYDRPTEDQPPNSEALEIFLLKDPCSMACVQVS